VTTQQCATRNEIRLVATGRQDRPLVGVAEKLVGATPHVQQVFRIGTDTAKNAKDRLHEKGCFDQAVVNKMCQVIQVTDVVALVFKSRAATFSKLLKDRFDIGERVAKDSVTRSTKIADLPRVLPLAKFVKRREESEVHRTHIERTHRPDIEPKPASSSGEPLVVPQHATKSSLTND
jgi:hypothetical protein